MFRIRYELHIDTRCHRLHTLLQKAHEYHRKQGIDRSSLALQYARCRFKRGVAAQIAHRLRAQLRRTLDRATLIRRGSEVQQARGNRSWHYGIT